jgi:serine/threonine protein phosphatase PrpC
MNTFEPSGPKSETERMPLPLAWPDSPSFNVKSFGLSDPGRVRSSNEDCFVIAELARTLYVHETNLPQSNATFSSHRGHVFIVADGVGGNAAGEVASSLSVASIEDFLLNTLRRFSNLQASEEQNVLRELQKALLQADSRIFEETAKHPQWRGMATTITFAFVVNWRLFVAHAGDCRCYLFSQGSLQRLTRDHTLTAELVRAGAVSPQDAGRHPFRHVVTNILGGDKPGVSAELYSLDLHPGDVLLLCSDGLTGMLPEDRIVAILQAEKEPQRACECLVAEANERGGRDNVTVIVAHMNGAGID